MEIPTLKEKIKERLESLESHDNTPDIIGLYKTFPEFRSARELLRIQLKQTLKKL